MKRFFLLATLLSVLGFINVLSAQVVKTEYKQGVSSEYKFEYEQRGVVFISNTNHPFENIPRVIWQYNVEITGSIGNIDEMVYKHIGPCVRALEIDENDNRKNSFFMSIDIGLDGVVKHIDFAYWAEIETIPVEVLEALETEIMRDHKLYLKYDPNDLEDVEYINIVRSYSLFNIKEEQLLKDNMVPDIPFSPNILDK